MILQYLFQHIFKFSYDEKQAKDLDSFQHIVDELITVIVMYSIYKSSGGVWSIRRVGVKNTPHQV